jgi:hypothetical protein
MKSRVVALGVGVFLMVSAAAARPARADTNKVQFQRAVVLTTLKACAIQLMITSIVNNQTNGSEAVTIDGVKIAGIARLAALGAALANKPFLVASPAFEAETGETADETISDADCEKLTPGTKLAFRGSFGNEAGSATIPTGFALNTAVVWTSNNLLVNLLVNSLQLARFVAALIVLGNGPLVAEIVASSGGGGGCAYAPIAAGTEALAALALLAIVIASRTRRSRAPS